MDVDVSRVRQMLTFRNCCMIGGIIATKPVLLVLKYNYYDLQCCEWIVLDIVIFNLRRQIHVKVLHFTMSSSVGR